MHKLFFFKEEYFLLIFPPSTLYRHYQLSAQLSKIYFSLFWDGFLCYIQLVTDAAQIMIKDEKKPEAVYTLNDASIEI